MTDFINNSHLCKTSQAPFGLVDSDNKFLCNFIPNVRKIYNSGTSIRSEHQSSASSAVLQVELIREDAYSVSRHIPLEKLDNWNPSETSPDLFVRDKKSLKLVVQLIRLQIPHVQNTPGICFTELGWHLLPDSTHVYVAGDTVWGSCSTPYYLAPTVSQNHFSCEHSSLCFKDMTHLLHRLSVISDASGICFFFLLLSGIRSLLMANASIEQQPPCALYLYAASGTGKSSLARTIFCHLFPSTPSIMQKASVQEINIGSSVSALSTKFVQFRDCTVLIDDLCTCSTNAEKRKRLETFNNILRKLGNESPLEYHIPGKRANARAYCQCTAVFTAEYPLSSTSDLTRTLHVRVKEGRADTSLRPLIGTAFHQYLLWFSQSMNSELVLLQRFFQSLSVSTAQERRMFWNYAYIAFIIQSFARFVEQTYHKSECFQTIEQPLNLFLHQLEAFQDAQFQLMHTLMHSDSDPLVTLYRAIHDKKLKFSQPQKNLWGHNSNPIDNPFAGGTLSRDVITTRLQILVDYLTQNGHPDLTTQTLSNHLSRHGILLEPTHKKEDRKRKARTFKGPDHQNYVKLSWSRLQIYVLNEKA